MLLWILMLACAGPEEAPERWPTEGCSAAAPAVGTTDRSTRHEHEMFSADGLTLALATRTPDGLDCAGAVVEAPPGFEAGIDQLDETQAKELAKAGLVVVSFDPRGRGESEGEEDMNGHAGQDDFADVLRWAASQPGVDPSQVVVWSRSIGGALASGALGRHTDLAPRAWVDFESPSWLEEDLEHTTEFTRDRMWALAEQSDDPSAWFDERSPAAYVGEVQVPYQRLQGAPDHALDYLGAAVNMLNGADSSPEVRLNGEVIDWEITEVEVKDRAIDGGVTPGSEEATEAVLAAFGS